jgi:hypothetical protein
VDDLIPPNTRLQTKAVTLTEAPEFRTTLVYYVSEPILSRLRKRQAQVTLEVIQLHEDITSQTIGSVELHMRDAKLVKMRNGNRKMAQVQQFVVDKGSWLSFGKGKIKAGLFIVQMPDNNKEMGTPLQTPIRTQQQIGAKDLGLEICSDMSDLFFNSEKEEDDDDYGEDYEDEDEEGDGDIDDEGAESSGGGEDDPPIIIIGDGLDQYSFLFRILEAKHISAIVNNYSGIEDIFFRYQFAKQEFQCYAENCLDGWKCVEYHNNILLQGDLQDIKEWFSNQPPIRVRLFIRQLHQEEESMIGFADIYLKGRDVTVVQQSSIIYDYDKKWYINAKKQFAKLSLQIGILDTWDDTDLQ